MPEVKSLYDQLPRAIQSIRNLSHSTNSRYRLKIVDPRVPWLGPYFEAEKINDEEGCCSTLFSYGVCSCPDREQNVGY